MIPRLSRMIVGPDNVKFLPMTCVPGGVFMLVIDTVARAAASPEIPLSILTEISGGERQQATLARVIVQQPKIIMFDEPTNHLDYGNQLRVVHMIKDLAKRGFAVVMTTHMPDHAIMLGGKTAILNRLENLICCVPGGAVGTDAAVFVCSRSAIHGTGKDQHLCFPAEAASLGRT